MLGNTVTRAPAFAAGALIVICQFAFASAETKPTGKVATELLADFKACAVRLRLEQRTPDLIVTAHGTAFGVDLKAQGLPGRSYLLSAGHNVVAPPSCESEIRIELGKGKDARWVTCEVKAIDTELDLCLLKCSENLPHLTRLCDMDVAPGNDVVLAGSPRGIPVQAYEGKLLRRFHAGQIHSLAQVAFDHGDSGGPIFDRRSGKVAGIAVAGIPHKGDLDARLGLYVPAPCIQSFLEDYQRQMPREDAPLEPVLDGSESRSAHYVSRESPALPENPRAQMVSIQDPEK